MEYLVHRRLFHGICQVLHRARIIRVIHGIPHRKRVMIGTGQAQVDLGFRKVP